ncbi:MAG: NAD-dependent epimerase/dehydratase family protein [Flavobacteriaceae bacterium]|nr:NAD-dependent epimerase/dehydratase family protein [Flavobacteriaceae bacterium]
MPKYRLLLTGASGFLGSHLLESFLNKGYEIVILKRTTSSLCRIEHLLDNVNAYRMIKEFLLRILLKLRL